MRKRIISLRSTNCLGCVFFLDVKIIKKPHTIHVPSSYSGLRFKVMTAGLINSLLLLLFIQQELRQTR